MTTASVPPVSAYADPVGIPEIAERAGVKRGTVDVWRDRKIFPAPDYTIGGRPAWEWATCWEWLKQTGRI